MTRELSKWGSRAGGDGGERRRWWWWWWFGPLVGPGGSVVRAHRALLFPVLLARVLPLPLRRRISFLTRRALPFSVYSIFLFSLCISRSSSRPRSRVHSIADFPVPGDPSAPRRLTNMALVRSLPSFAAPAKTRKKKPHREEFAFCALANPSYSPYSPTLDFIREISLLRRRHPDSPSTFHWFESTQGASIFFSHPYKEIILTLIILTKFRRNYKEYFDVIRFLYINRRLIFIWWYRKQITIKYILFPRS